jgi:hypothetical protein
VWEKGVAEDFVVSSFSKRRRMPLEEKWAWPTSARVAPCRGNGGAVRIQHVLQQGLLLAAGILPVAHQTLGT